MTKREQAIRVATATLLIGGALLFAYGFVQSQNANDQAEQVRVELNKRYSVASARPPAPAVRLNLSLPSEDNFPRFPTPAGVHMQSFGMTSDGVTVLFRGRERASGWCFRVAYSGDNEPEVSKASCT